MTDNKIAVPEISQELADRAFAGISFDPKKRGKSVIGDYNNTCQKILSKLNLDGLDKDENIEIINSCFTRYHTLYTKWLSAMSRTYSVMITGGSNFNNAKHDKMNRFERNALERLVAFDIYYQVKNRLKKKAKYENIAEIKKQGMETTILFELPDKEIKGINNKSLERVQVIFPGKPVNDIRSKLKQQAFRWSPTNNAWQRKNTSNGMMALSIIKDFLKEYNKECYAT